MNTFIESNKGKHFTLSDRISIEAGIEKGWSFKKIADELGKSPSSVSREVRRHLIFSLHYYDDRSRRKSECIYFSSCSKQGVCGNLSCSSLCSKCRSRKCASFCPSFTTAKCELVTCSHHLISDFEVGASCSMALQSQVSTSYPRVPRDFY